MNLIGTLARVAIGTMIARGVGKMISGSGSGTGMGGRAGNASGGLGGLLGDLGGGTGQPSAQGGLGGLDGLLGSLGGGTGQQSSQGGLGGLLGSLGGNAGQQSSQGGLGGLLGSLGGGAGQQSAQGGLGGLLGSVLSGSGTQSGGLGGLLGSLGGGNQSGGAIGDQLNHALEGKPVPEPTPAQNTQAEIMLRAMINAAKCDGHVDPTEEKTILSQLDGSAPDEIAFVRREMQAPLNFEQFVASVPSGLQQEVYLMSLLGISLDSDAEVQYLDKLAKALGISERTVNEIHAKVGVPALYT